MRRTRESEAHRARLAAEAIRLRMQAWRAQERRPGPPGRDQPLAHRDTIMK